MTAARARAGRRTWWATIAATGVSAYVLDVTATAAGIGLVASGLLAGLPQPWLPAVLALSYAAWGWGMRANIRANAALLTSTGLSTNVFSKAAYDLARRLTPSARARRWAAATGYVGTELAKEAPYYAGAFGVALLSDPVTSAQALIFLTGSNVGAMAYEYGAARLTHLFLRRRARAGETMGEPVQRDDADDFLVWVRRPSGPARPDHPSTVLHRSAVDPDAVYRMWPSGFGARLTPDRVAQLRRDPDVSDVVADAPDHPAPYRPSTSPDRVDGSYLVWMANDSDPAATAQMAGLPPTAALTAPRGFAGALTDQQRETVRRLPGVLVVVDDVLVTVDVHREGE